MNFKITYTKIFSVIFIFYCSGWVSFIPLTISSGIGLILGGIGLLYGINHWLQGMRKVDLILFSLSILLPIISAIQAYRFFGQPITIGLLSMRSYLNLLVVYAFIGKFNSKQILVVVSAYQLFIMAFDTLLLYGMNIDDNWLLALIPQDENTVFTKTATVENNLRGARLGLGTGLTWLAMTYWSTQYHLFRSRKDFLFMIITLLFVFFVSKSRVSLLICFLIMILPLVLDANKANIRKAILISGCLLFLFFAIPAISSRFLVVFDLFGDNRTEGTGDFSGVARLNEILVAIPYILKSPLFGVGNISYHFKGGFNGILNEYFFLADIGIVGMLFLGGVFYCMNYLLLFKIIGSSYRIKDSFNYIFAKIISWVYIVLPFFGFSPIMANSTYISILLLLTLDSSKFYGRNISR